MKKYYIQRFYKTNIALSKNRKAQQADPLPGWDFKFPHDNVSICVKDEVVDVDGSRFHIGLDIIAEVDSENMDDAINTSMMYSEAVVNMFVFSTLSKCDILKIISVIEFDNDMNANFRNNVYPPDLSDMIPKIVPLEFDTFNKIYEGCNRLNNSKRLMRAMSWLKKGINEKNSVDKFISFWVGIEIIKCFSQKDTNTDSDNSIAKNFKKITCGRLCKEHCVAPRVDEWTTIENIFIKKLKRSDFRKVKGARNAILHGFGELSPMFHDKIEEYQRVAMEVLLWGLGDIIGIEDELVKSIIKNGNWEKTLNMWYIIGGGIEGLSGEIREDFKNFPKIKLGESGVKNKINDDGSISVQFENEFKPSSGSKNIKWMANFLEMRGE